MKYDINLIKNKNWIMENFPFKENDEGDLIYNPGGEVMFIFKFYQRSSTIDFISISHIYGKEKEDIIIRSFSYECPEDREMLKDAIRK